MSEERSRGRSSRDEEREDDRDRSRSSRRHRSERGSSERDAESRHRRKRRDSSSSPSSSSSDEREKKRRKKHKKDKKEKKDRKHKKDKKDKKDKRDKKDKSSSKDDKRKALEEQAKAFLQKNASMGEKTVMLTNSDYFTRNPEFSLWLKETKGIYFEDLSANKSRKKFSKFVELWNRGSLPDKYYKGISAQELEHNTRTKYHWGFTDKLDGDEALKLGSVRDEIARETNREAKTKRPPQPSSSSSISSSTSATTSQRAGPKGPAVKHPDDEELDDEDKRRYDRLMRKKQEKAAHSYREAVMEELAPKADPGSREARLEKRAQKGAYARGREDSPELADSDVMGGDDSFQERLRQEKERRMKRETARSESIQQKMAAHQAKEDAIMQQFRNMLAQRQASGNNPGL